MSHILNINVTETYNCKTFRLDDSSIYDELIATDNILIEIKPPGKNCFIEFPILELPWTIKVFNCTDLEICAQSQLPVQSLLPDGIYEIKYSVAPNLSTLVHFYHLRTCQLMKTYTQAVCDFFSKKCDLTQKEVIKVEDKLTHIKNMIDAAKYKVEECGDKELGLELYEEARNLLKDFNNGKCGCS